MLQGNPQDSRADEKGSNGQFPFYHIPEAIPSKMEFMPGISARHVSIGDSLRVIPSECFPEGALLGTSFRCNGFLTCTSLFSAEQHVEHSEAIKILLAS